MNSSLKFWLTVTRPLQCSIAGAAAWIAALLSNGPHWFTQEKIAAALCAYFSCLGASLLHYGVRHEMYRDKWWCPVHVPNPHLLVRLGIIASMISVNVAGLFLNTACLIIALSILVAIYAYGVIIDRYWPWKNLTASAVCITPILIGWFSGHRIHPAMPYLLLSAFFLYMAREILKDIEDVQANRGKRFTMVMEIGPTAAMRLGSACLLLALLFYGIASLHVPFHSLLVAIPFLLGGWLFFQLAIRLLLASEHAFKRYKTIDAGIAMLMSSLLAVRAGF